MKNCWTMRNCSNWTNCSMGRRTSCCSRTTTRSTNCSTRNYWNWTSLMKSCWRSMTSFGNNNLPQLQRFCPWYQPTPINSPFWNDRVSVEYLILFSSHQTAFTRSIDPVKPLPEPLPVDPSLPCDPLGCDPLGWEPLVLVSPVDPPLPSEALAARIIDSGVRKTIVFGT